MGETAVDKGGRQYHTRHHFRPPATGGPKMGQDVIRFVTVVQQPLEKVRGRKGEQYSKPKPQNNLQTLEKATLDASFVEQCSLQSGQESNRGIETFCIQV